MKTKIKISFWHAVNEPSLIKCCWIWVECLHYAWLYLNCNTHTVASLSRGRLCNKCFQWAGYSSSAYLLQTEECQAPRITSRYKREPVHHLEWASAVWVIWCSSSSSTYSRAQPKHQHLATVRNPNPSRLSFQTLRYAPSLLFGFDRVSHSCLLGTVAKLFMPQISQGGSWKSSSDIDIWSLPQSCLCGRACGCVPHPYENIHVCGFRSLYVFLLNLCVNFKIKVNKNEAVKRKEYQDTII